MKLHHLRMKGIGPFRDEVVIDFAALGASGLFLLEGPTGSGKTTILDAVVFALYGSVSGVGSDEGRIRSHFSDPTEPSVVDLVFETGQGIYRVRRTPAYQRAKKRGTGTTAQNPTAVLWRVGSPELISAIVADAAGRGAGLEPISSRPQEVGTEIMRALGLTREQFTQTVMLPQNEFARFLRADTQQRQAVLERVFGTEVYARVEKRLEEMRKASKREVDTATAELQAATARLLEASRLSADPPDPADGDAAEARPADGVGVADGAGSADGADSADGVDVAGGVGSADGSAASETAGAPERATWADLCARMKDAAERLNLEVLREGAGALVERARSEAASAEHKHAAARAAEQAARSRAESAKATRVRIERRRELDALITRLRTQRREAEEAQRSLAIDAAARGVISALDRRDQARTARDRAVDVLDAARVDAQDAMGVDAAQTLLARVPASTELLSDGASGAAALTAVQDAQQRATADAGALRELLEVEKGLSARETKLAEDRTELEDSDTTLTMMRVQAAEMPKARAATEERRQAAEQAAQGHAEATLAVRTAAEALQAATRAETHRAELAQAKDTLAQRVSVADQAARTEADLRRRRYAGIAAELASDLEDDAACPVCGSREHPAPAEPSADRVTAPQIEAAEQARQAADRDVSAAERHRDLIAERLQEQEKHAAGHTVQSATEAHKTAQDHLASIEAQQETLRAITAELANHDQLARELDQQIQKFVLDRTALRERVEHAATQLEQDRARLTRGRGTAGSIAERHETLMGEARTAGSLHAALQALIHTQEQFAERTTEAVTARTAAQEELDAALLGAELGTGLDTEPGTQAGTAPGSEAQHPVAQSGASAAPVQAQVVLPEDDEGLRGVALAAPRRRELQQLLQRHRDEHRRWQDGMAEPGIREASATDEALESARAAEHAAAEALTAAQQALEAATGRRATAEAVHRSTGGAADALRTSTENAARTREHAGAVVRVADLATGTSSDGERIRLSTYVLMRRFEDVIVAANARLANFRRSELELVRDTGARGARRTGLDLKVIDRRTDQMRVPETLSGGETFMVSLALALGLADIVTAEAGGVQMETLFIDEGFGSLDPESLEDVVAEIGRLAAHGRTIGVVSHVGEMKSQIAEKIQVRRTPGGASRATVIA